MMKKLWDLAQENLVNTQGTVDERPNLGYDSEKVKNFSPQTGFEPTPLGEMSFQAVSSTTEL